MLADGEQWLELRSRRLLRRCDGLPPDVLLELAVAWAQTHTTPCKSRAELARNFDTLLARERAKKGIAA